MNLKDDHKKLLFLVAVLFSASVSSYSQSPIADLIDRVKPSVVKLIVFDDSGSSTKIGTGFFISKSKLVTNKHVIDGAKSVRIKMFDETDLYTNNIQTIPNTDIAILDFDAKGNFVKPLPIAATPPRVGDRVIVYGAPLGLEGSVSDGVISAFRNLEGNDLIQLTAPISTGSSGSPVLDLEGRVIGVATLSIKGGQSLNFAIPVASFSSYILNDISTSQAKTGGSSKSTTENMPISSKRDITGSWLNLMNGHTYQIVDDGEKLAISWWLDPLVCKWYGDIAIGYVPGSFFVALKPMEGDRVGVWLSAKLRPTDSEERILKILTKNTRAKPAYVLQLK